MKIIASVTLLSISLSALACPSLSGNYRSCKVESSSPDMNVQSISVKQTDENGVTIYSATSTDTNGVQETDTIVTDGKPTTETTTQNDGSHLTITTVTTCVGDSVVMAQTIQAPDNQLTFKGKETISKLGDALVIDISLEDTTIAKITCQ
jgi:hypothetical protein